MSEQEQGVKRVSPAPANDTPPGAPSSGTPGLPQAGDLEAAVRQRVGEMREALRRTGAAGLLVAITEELSSLTTAALCKRATDALSAETGRDYWTVGVIQPYGEESGTEAIHAAASKLGLQRIIVTNIEDTVGEMVLEAEYGLKGLGIHRHLSRSVKEQLEARTRLLLQQALATDLNLLAVGDDTWAPQPLSGWDEDMVRQAAVHLGIPGTRASGDN